MFFFLNGTNLIFSFPHNLSHARPVAMLRPLLDTARVETHRVVDFQLVVLHVVGLLEHNQVEVDHADGRNPETNATRENPVPVSHCVSK